MKKILLFLTAIFLTAGLIGQNKAYFPYHFYGGISVGGVYSTNAHKIQIDSIGAVSNAYKLYSGATLLYPFGVTNNADTASMLSKYLLKTDTTHYQAKINLRVKIADTASMLTPYVNHNDTASMLSTYGKASITALKLAKSDTAAMLTPYVNHNDTTSMLSKYARKLSPVFTTPNIGTATGSITGNAGTVTGFTPASGSLTLSGADAVTVNTIGPTNVNWPTSGTFATTQNINDSIMAGVELYDVAIAGSVIKKTIGWHGATEVDFVLPDSAGIGNHYIDLGAIVPAQSKVMRIDIRNTEALAGPAAHEISIGASNVVGTAVYVVAATCDDLNNGVGSTSVLTDAITVNWASATNVWIKAVPDGRWDQDTAGKWSVYVTYIYYGDI